MPRSKTNSTTTPPKQSAGHLSQYAFKRAELEDIPNIDMRRASSYNLKELNDLRRRLAKRANQRLRDIERAGFTSAYVYATTMSSYLQPTERRRFYEGRRQMDLFTLREELNELRWFLSARTSTVGGIRSFERETTRRFQGYTSFKQSPDQFWKFLSSETVKHLKKLGYSSEELIEFYDFATENKVSYEDIMNAVKQFEKGKIEAWDELYEEVGLNYFH